MSPIHGHRPSHGEANDSTSHRPQRGETTFSGKAILDHPSGINGRLSLPRQKRLMMNKRATQTRTPTKRLLTSAKAAVQRANSLTWRTESSRTSCAPTFALVVTWTTREFAKRFLTPCTTKSSHSIPARRHDRAVCPWPNTSTRTDRPPSSRLTSGRRRLR